MAANPSPDKLRKAIEEDLIAKGRIKSQMDTLKDELSEIDARLMDNYEALGEKTVKTEDGDLRINGTLVAPSRVILDEPKLKKRLGATMWNKITTRVLDKNKLDAHIKSGEISTSVIAACSDEKPSKPYIKITTK